MRKLTVIISGLLALAMATSCQSKKEETPLSALNGEWNIVKIDGKELSTSSNHEAPFIVFDTATGQLYGFSGCNRMMGSFNTDTQPGILQLEPVNTTRMACPDMTVEQSVIEALSKVKSFAKEMDYKMVLRGADDKDIMVIEKKKNDITVSDLAGQWEIIEVQNEQVPSGMENQPFIEFNEAEARIHGNAGCNIFNGGYQIEEGNPLAISFPNTITTMMSCPDMEIESKIINALNGVASFDKVDNGVGLYNAEGLLVLVLQKK